MSVPPSDGPAPVGRRRIVMLPERVLTPLALIAREGEERDSLEHQLERTRPVVTFPSLAHFCTDSARKERWAGVVLARTHAWDSQLDSFVARRAFIALYALEDEGYGWPEAVRRIAGPEELEAWLQMVTSPVLPEDDKPRPARVPVRPRKDRGTRISIALAPVRGTVKSETKQLTLPISAEVASQPAAQGVQESSTASNAPSVAASTSSPSASASTAPGAQAAAPKRRGRPPKLRPSAEELALAAESAFVPKPRPERSTAVARSKPARPTAASLGSDEARIAAFALEFGFARAAELLELVREKAHRVARWPGE